MSKFLKLNEVDKISHFDILTSFFLLGLTSFGGPIAHIGYFRNTFVHYKKWIDEQTYIDMVSLCNFLPGPSSSQVGMSIGYKLKGISGALLAFIGFTSPSALVLIIFGYTIINFQNSISTGMLQGLKAIVVIIVLQAIIGMRKNLLTDNLGYVFTITTSIVLIFFPSSTNQFLCLIVSAILGFVFYKNNPMENKEIFKFSNIKIWKCFPLFLFFAFLILLSSLNQIFDNNLLIKVANSFYKIGSLVFGGGHVVLPLLQTELVLSGLINEDIFLAGYGASQAIPGPLFTFSAYLGIFLNSGLHSGLMGLFCLFFIFLPSFLLIIGTLPIWEEIRKVSFIKRSFKAVNASVIGLLIAALYNPIISSTLKSKEDLLLISFAFLILFFTKTPQWLAVFLLGLSGWGIALI